MYREETDRITARETLPLPWPPSGSTVTQGLPAPARLPPRHQSMWQAQDSPSQLTWGFQLPCSWDWSMRRASNQSKASVSMTARQLRLTWPISPSAFHPLLRGCWAKVCWSRSGYKEGRPLCTLLDSLTPINECTYMYVWIHFLFSFTCHVIQNRLTNVVSVYGHVIW